MREILFRGKRVDNGEWVEAECYKHYKGDGIWEDSPEKEIYFVGGFACDTETIGQYTGLTDKNGNKVFENDIVKVRFWSDWGECYEVSNGTIKWENGKNIIYIFHYCMRLDLVDHPEIEVVGNIFENGEII